MSMDRKVVLNELYDALLVTFGAVGASMIAKKIAGMPLGTPESLKGAIKLAGAVGVQSMVVNLAKEKK